VSAIQKNITLFNNFSKALFKKGKLLNESNRDERGMFGGAE
jgi:hypothetical protein